MKNKKWLLISLILFCQSGFAAESSVVHQYETVNFEIAKDALTRISVKNDRIKSARGLQGKFQIEHDDSNGSLFIRPNADVTFKLHIATESGGEYTLALTPQFDAHDSIVLIPNTPSEKASRKKEGIEAHDVIALMKVMTQNLIDSNYIRQPITQKPYFKGNLSFKKLAEYQGKKYIGSVIELKNTSKKSLRLTEKQFYFDDVVAVGLLDVSLAPLSSTLLYSVKKNG